MKNTARKNFMTKTLALLFVLSGMAVFAAQNETVGRALNILRPDVKVQISGAVIRDGQQLALDKAEAVKAGETLDWTIVSANEGNASAQDYRVVGQIPKGTIFVEGSAGGEDAPQVSFSVDDGKTFSAQPTINEKQADGSVKQVAAPISMYSQVKFEWANPLASQAKLNADYQVRVK